MALTNNFLNTAVSTYKAGQPNPLTPYGPSQILANQGQAIQKQAAQATNGFNGIQALTNLAQQNAAKQPAVQGTPTVGSASNGAAAQPAVDPGIDQYYSQLQGGVQSQIDRLGNQAAIGNQNIADSYNSAYNTLTGQKATADRDYQTNKDQSLQDLVQAKGQIQAGVGSQTNSIQRLLGSRGFGNSSAALVAAPYAAGVQGNAQNQATQKTYGRNQQALDTNYGDYNNQYNTSLTDLGRQRDTQKNQLQASIEQSRSSLLSQLASIAQQQAQAKPGATYADVTAAAAPYQSQINSLGSVIDNLGRTPAIQATPATYKAPTLETYDPTANQATASVAGAPGVASNAGSFTNLLLNQNQKKTGINNVGAYA